MSKTRFFKPDQIETRKETFLEVFELMAGNISATCKAVSPMSRRTFYEWCRDDPDFKKKIEDVKEGLIDMAESKLHEMINEKNTAAVLFYLKTQAKNRGYIERNEIEHEVDGNINVVIKSNWDGNEEI